MAVQTRFHIRRKVFALLVCLVFSSILWLLNDLNRPQAVTIQIPVRFTGLPYDMVTTNSLPTTMSASVEATGFDLLWRRYTTENRVVDIPLRLEKGGVDVNRSYLFNINYYLQDIAEALGTHLKIRRIFPDTFSIRFEKKYVKKVPVKLASHIQFEKEFNRSGNISIQPDSVIISGTKEKINAIDSVLTEVLTLASLRKSYEGAVNLANINGISYNVGDVKVKIPVEQYTEKTISLKVTPTNVPANYELNTIPDVVSVKLSVPLSAFNKLNMAAFNVSAEFPSLNKHTDKILLKVDRTPDFVKVLHIDPAAVEYKIKAKE